MKKFIILLICTATSFITFGQNESDHLSFKGVPINGPLSEFVTKMKQAGFSFVDKRNDISILHGDFAGYKNCLITVTTVQPANIVNTIGVVFTKQEDWTALESDYDQLKSMLTEKYGEPSNIEESFQAPLPRTNRDKLYALSFDKCTWRTTYETPKGSIQLFLYKASINQFHVMLKYFDKINTATVMSSAMDDL